jgi:hypothetical protein
MKKIFCNECGEEIDKNERRFQTANVDIGDMTPISETKVRMLVLDAPGVDICDGCALIALWKAYQTFHGPDPIARREYKSKKRINV